MSWTDEEILRRRRDAEKTEERGSALIKSNLWQAEGRTDAANAKSFARQFGADYRYCDPWKSWLNYSGKSWMEDQTCAIDAAAKQFANSLWNDAAKIVGNPDASEQLKNKVIAFVKSSNSASGIRNMIALAKSEPGMTVLPEQLDKNPFLLNTSNGTLNLKTGELQPHRREDLLMKIVAVDFDPDAKCEQFAKFMNSVFASNQNLIGFIQRLLGYAITGDVSEQILAIFYGEGSNGKSTLLTLLLDLLADYGCKAPEKLLTAKRYDSHPTELAKLFGKRLVVANETEDGAELSEA
ncbi:MAG TPA: phage/plasmid primase, P4 family, partial [Pirellulales bacterium]